jgi:hypothetical protein
VTSPDVRYARSGDVAIAYQVVGSGPIDIVFVRGIAGVGRVVGPSVNRRSGTPGRRNGASQRLAQ